MVAEVAAMAAQTLEQRILKLETDLNREFGALNNEFTTIKSQIAQNKVDSDNIVQSNRTAINLDLEAAKTAIGNTVQSTNDTFAVHQQAIETTNTQIQALVVDAGVKFDKLSVLETSITQTYKQASESYNILSGQIKDGGKQASDTYNQAKLGYEEMQVKTQALIDQLSILHGQVTETYGKSKDGYEELSNKTEAMKYDADKKFKDIEDYVRTLEKQAEGIGGRRNVDNPKGKYIPLKNIMPKILGGKVEEWRLWKEDVVDYLDEITVGMKEYLA